MNSDIQAFNEGHATVEEQRICDILATTIYQLLPESESKIWHRHPAWFINGNPIVDYSRPKSGIRLMFWSGASFDEDKLKVGSGKFKDASILFTQPDYHEEHEGRRRRNA